jgi:hypothetical protein
VIQPDLKQFTRKMEPGPIAIHPHIKTETADESPFKSKDASPRTNFDIDEMPGSPDLGGLVPLWSIWPGKNYFCCKGRLITGPKKDRKMYGVTWAVLLFPSICYCIVILPYLTVAVSPALPAIMLTSLALSIISLLCASLSDPGIIPRRPIFELVSRVPAEFTAEVLLSDEGVSYKFCGTCEIFRPLRSHHCGVCDNCVEQFDHHCAFLNNCIGKRNYFYFLCFLVSSVLLGLAEVVGLFIFLLYDQAKDHEKRSFIHEAQAILAISIVELVASVGITTLILVLCCFHISLVCS